jgi:hypothetical protein
MMFPLHYTAADAEDILPPGNYRLDAVDKDGTPLEITVALSVQPHRNADPGEAETATDVATVVATALPGPTSDVRLVLEANVRATQMAFLHNQRTLEISLRPENTRILSGATTQDLCVKSRSGRDSNPRPPA